MPDVATMVVVVLVIITAVSFDFTNGFHDTANAMATSIATGALKPKTAVIAAGALNLVGAFLSVAVANTVSSGLINGEADGSVSITPAMIFAGLVGAIIWNLLTWLVGLPSSSSHAMFGGLIGAAIVGLGWGSVNYPNIIAKVLLPAFISPVIAGAAAFLATRLAFFLARKMGERQRSEGFRHGQTVTALLVALSHGTNDAQKTMGVITLVLISAHLQPTGSNPQIWVILVCGLAIAAGTYSGGWRVIRTLGRGITDISTPQGFAAEASSAAAILASSHLGFALSTTQVCSGSVMGAGLGRKGGTVRWSVAGRMALAWLVTLPAAAIMGGGAGALTKLPGVWGVALVVVIALGVVWGILRLSRRNPVTADNVNDAAAAPTVKATA